MTVEDRLTEWGMAARAAVAPVHVSVEQFGHRGRARKRCAAMAVAAAAVVALAVTIAVARRDDPANPTGPTIRQPAVVRFTPTPAPAAFRNVTFHGLTVTVPSGWPDNATRCGSPTENTVISGDGASPDCAILRAPRVTSVTFSTLHSGETSVGSVRTEVAGRSADRTDTTTGGLHTRRLDVPSLAAVVTISSRSTAEIDRLVATLQVSGADANGCPAKVADVRPGQRYGRGSAHSMVSGDPTSLVICGYSFGYLQGSVRMRPAQAAATLNALPAGLSAALGNSIDSTSCWPGSGPVDSRLAIDAYAFVLRFGFVDGTIQQLHARLGFCGNLGITNGTRTGQRTPALLALLTKPAFSGLAYPGQVRPSQ